MRWLPSGYGKRTNLFLLQRSNGSTRLEALRSVRGCLLTSSGAEPHSERGTAIDSVPAPDP